MDYLDTIRARVRREAILWMRRMEWTTWELTENVVKSGNLPASERFNAPKLAYRTIAGLIDGKASQANTVRLMHSYLISDADMTPILLDVFPQTVRTAQAMMRALHLAPYTLKKADLMPYVGVYSVSAFQGPYVICFIVDFEPVNQVLLARCVLRERWQTQLLHGYVIPGDHRFTVHLISPEYRTEYLLLVDHEERRLPFEPPRNTRLMGKANGLVHVSVPLFEAGALRSFPYEPNRAGLGTDFAVEYLLRKHRSEHEDSIDVLRDDHNFISDVRDIGFYPRYPVEDWDGRPYYDDDD
jgi:hypothetical protein